MDLAQSVISQYYAALAMLEEAVQRCPDELWDADDPPNRFYQIAYHALFYTHLYLQPTQTDFTPWEKHVEGHQSFGQPGHPGAPAPEAGAPYTKSEIQEYLDFCRTQVSTVVPALDFEVGSGFPWLPFGKLELQFYSIRHLTLHTGELAERLSAASGIEVGWVGKGPDDSA